MTSERTGHQDDVAAGSESFEWGTEIGTTVVGKIPFKTYQPRRTVLSELFIDARRWRDREHLVQGDRRMTFAEVDQASLRAATALARHVESGERILLLGSNSIDWVVAFWGIIRSGAVVVLGNGWWSGREVAHAIDQVEPRLVIADQRRRELLGEIAPHVDVIALEKLNDLAPGRESELPAITDENAPALVLYTSGTNGSPKGAVLSHRSAIALQHALLHVTGRLPHQLSSDYPREVALQTGPLFHIGGVQGILRVLLTGGTLVFTRGRFDPEEVLELIERERVHRWGGTPTMVTRVLQAPSLAVRDVRSLQAMTLGGTYVPPQTLERVRVKFPSAALGISTIYGLSEAGGTLTAASGRDMVERPGTSGRALPIAEIRIDRPDEAGVGEVLARSPTQMDRYWGERENPIDAQGWLHTGDLGRIDQDGYLYVVDRAKDVVIRGGENVASAHVEDCLRSHAGVLDVAVVGLSDEDLGEIVGAVVVLAPSSGLTVDELREHARDRLAYFEVPERWWFRTRPFELNASGKVAKRQLRESWPDPAVSVTDERVLA